MPELMEVLVMKDGMELPPPEMPYYVLAKESLYLHKRTQIGTVLIPEKKLPYTVGSIGEYKEGVFSWAGDALPGHIVGQATSFFRRIYEKHKTEAEVLIVKHNETGAYRLFVPYQRTSGAGVKSLFEPTHVHKDYSIIGTLHSHCMMPAFHSGTDTADASDMDGVHFTIGHVLQHPPQIVAMVSMNKKNFHYAQPKEIADLEFDEHPAPAWWDNYVFPAGTPSEKPKGLTSITDIMWNQFKGIHTPTPVRTPYEPGTHGGFRPHWGRGSEDFSLGRPRALPVPVITNVTAPAATNASKRFNSKQERRHAKTERQRSRGRFKTIDAKDAADWMTISLALDEAEDTGVFHDADWNVFGNDTLNDITFWKKFFADRMGDVADVLDTLGMHVEFNVREKPAKLQLPGQTTMDQHIGGML